MATVQIPPVLRGAIGGEKTVLADGPTLGDVLARLYVAYPGLREALQPDDDRLSRRVNIYVDDEDARTLQGADTPTAAASTIIILPAMAGGAAAAADR